MNAKEALATAKKVKAKPLDVSSLIQRVDQFIEGAALKGETKITVNPLVGLRCIVTDAEAVAVWSEFRRRGFEITDTHRNFCVSWRK